MQKRSIVCSCLAAALLITLFFGWQTSFGLEDSSPDQYRNQTGSSLPQISAGDQAGSFPLKGAFNGGASYDSGWVTIGQDQSLVLPHNLGGSLDHYTVNMVYRNANNGINQRYYGGADYGANITIGSPNDRVGAYWRSLTTADITVYRRPEDTFAEQIRIRIWVDDTPANYDSGWLNINPNTANTRIHALGGNADDYVVDLQYRNPGSGINQRYYGGCDFGTNPPAGLNADDRVGAYWYGLTNVQISIFRRLDDIYAEEFRVRIWIRPKATYDSGWRAVNQDQAITLSHQIGGHVDDYLVLMEFKDNLAALGINHVFYGGKDTAGDSRQGAYWRSLTDSTIVVYRRPDDIYADQVRIRIFNAWRVPPPNYDSGWVDLGAGSDAAVLPHQVGGDTNDYLVDMQYKGGNDDGVNLRYYGGADFGANPAPGHNPDDRVGAYWRSLTPSTITVFRRAEDTYAGQVRLRIWTMPKPDFDSGWTALAQDTATALTHDLGGDPGDYLVDMQQRSGGNGVNQRHYGGADFGANPPEGMNANDRVGAYWRKLTNSSITVYRRPEDIYAPEVRVRIWRIARPGYDSGWVNIAQDTARTLAHNLNGRFGNYLVNLNYWDTNPDNILNQRYFGGADFGTSPPAGHNADDRVSAYWRSLDDTSITVYRRPQDGFVDFFRLRIWGIPSQDLYLPLIQKN